MTRHVSLCNALRERYAFGRLFAATRIKFATRGQRFYYMAFAPALPLLLLGRMAGAALRSRRLTVSFLRSLYPVTLLVLWWSLGEWLGYITGRLPGSPFVAPEMPDALPNR